MHASGRAVVSVVHMQVRSTDVHGCGTVGMSTDFDIYLQHHDSS